MREAWPYYNPGQPFLGNWHLDAICDHLEAVSSSQIRRLIINMPPRMGKSSTVSVAWPAWLWITRPEFRWIFTSYAQPLATRDSVATRNVILSPWYQRHWGMVFRLTDDTNLKTRFANDKGGERLATSVSGAITGEGANCIVVDDPNNVKKIESDTIREETIRWWNEVMSSRLNNPKEDTMVIVSQRTHEGDLCGAVLEAGGYEQLILPMEYEPSILVNGYEMPPTSIGWVDPRTEPGELLWPERVGKKEVESMKEAMGPFVYPGQLQQRPVGREGGILKAVWWQEYDQNGFTVPADAQVIQVLDTAYKEHSRADYSVIATWAKIGHYAYLLDIYRERVGFPELKKMAVEKYEQYMPGEFLIENKASGPSLHQELMVETDIPAILVNPKEDKETRTVAITPTLKAGRCWIPREAPWKAKWLSEHSRYPRDVHDDQVDTTTMAVEWLFPRGEGGALNVRDAEKVDTLETAIDKKEVLEILYENLVPSRAGGSARERNSQDEMAAFQVLLGVR